MATKKVGNVIVGQSGGPTSVINSSLAGVYSGAKAMGLGTVYGMRHGIQGFLEGRFVNLDEQLRGDIDIELLKRTPSSYLRSCRFKLPQVVKGDATFEAIFAKLKELNIKYFFYIGGNDSMDTICKLHDYGQIVKSDIRFIGVPKTIDNDLDVTDHTPGFGSAAKYVATMTKEIIQDASVYDAKIITVIEVMGRNAGWLTAATALANGDDSEGVDLIYLPELAFDMNECIASVKKLMKKKESVVIAVSEGIWEKKGMNMLEEASKGAKVDAFGHKSLSGVGKCIASQLGKVMGCKTRTIEFSSIQRCGSHMASKTDIDEAFQVGFDAVKAANAGKSGLMVALKRTSNDPYTCVTREYDVHKIANVEKKVPRKWINAEGNFVTEDFINYARPLIQGELLPFMKDGLPMHLLLPKDR